MARFHKAMAADQEEHDLHWEFRIDSSNLESTRGEALVLFPRDAYPFVMDVRTDRDDVVVDLVDRSTNRFVATLSGPWLTSREVALVELLSIIDDAVKCGEKKRPYELMAKAIRESRGLWKPIPFAPASPMGIVVFRQPNRISNTYAFDVNVWMRVVHVRQRANVGGPPRIIRPSRADLED